jgi:hypothetical protein
VSLKDAFDAVWKQAYETYGRGTPQGGERFDTSAQFRQMRDSVTAAAPDARWQGAASEAYAKVNTDHAEVFGKLADLDNRYAAEIDKSAAVVMAGRRSLDTTRSNFMAAAAGLDETKLGDRTLMMKLVSGGVGEIQDTMLKTTKAQAEGGQRLNGITAEYAALGNTQKFGPSQHGPGAEDGPIPNPPDPEPQIPESKDPKDIKKWWDSLTPAQQQQLVKDHPDKVGGLNGVPTVGTGEPPVGRDAANRAVLQQDLDRVNNAARGHHVSADQVIARPENYGLSPNDVTRYNNANQVQKGLDDTTKRTNAPSYLQVYEPDMFEGRGRAAIAMGDPDKAANTTVVVPGTGNSVAKGWLDSTDASNLFNEANKADYNNHTAVIAWMGYQAPDSMLDPAVGQTALAHRGASLLAQDVNALSATHDGPLHLTVVGHSYGSTTVSDAAAGYNMHANDVVLIGCPGTDLARTAADFHLDGGHVYVGDASSDPVPQFSKIPQGLVPGMGLTGNQVALGNDPAMDGYGSTRFKAEVPGFNAKFWEDHSHYYQPGSESLFSMSDIVSGHGDALEHDQMTAPHRHPGLGALGDVLSKVGVQIPDLPLFDDPEFTRQGTGGHEHK